MSTHPSGSSFESEDNDGDDINCVNDIRYTIHIEPARVGGERFIRCVDCGNEVIPADPDLLHTDGCGGADE